VFDGACAMPDNGQAINNNKRNSGGLDTKAESAEWRWTSQQSQASDEWSLRCVGEESIFILKGFALATSAGMSTSVNWQIRFQVSPSFHWFLSFQELYNLETQKLNYIFLTFTYNNRYWGVGGKM
jgi:hypothetical protein